MGDKMGDKTGTRGGHPPDKRGDRQKGTRDRTKTL